MKFKEMIRSKTFWTGIGSVVGGVLTVIEGNQQAGIQLIIGGLGMIFLRDAIAKKGE